MEIFDAHADTVSVILDQEKSLKRNDLHVDAERLFEYSGYTQVFAAFISPEYRETAMERTELLIGKIVYEAELCGIEVCKSYADWKNSKKRVKAFLSLEGGEPINNISDLDKLSSLGIRIIAPTWNYQNKIACGVLCERDTGLTTFGASVIRKMEEMGIMVDLSHLGEKSFWDIVKILKKPPIASHSNSKSVKDNPRNLTDSQFLKICELGGCVGINLYPPFLGENIRDIVRHIDRFLELGGENHIGLGSDFDGVDCLPDGAGGCQDMSKIIKMLPYSAKIREKIAYKNFIRVIKSQNC